MTRFVLDCPACGARVPYKDVKGMTVACPNCQEMLEIPSYYWWCLFAVAILMSIFVCWLIGLQGLVFLFITAILLYPFILVAVVLSAIIFPPRLRRHRPDTLELYPRNKRRD